MPTVCHENHTQCCWLTLISQKAASYATAADWQLVDSWPHVGHGVSQVLDTISAAKIKGSSIFWMSSLKLALEEQGHESYQIDQHAFVDDICAIYRAQLCVTIVVLLLLLTRHHHHYDSTDSVTVCEWTTNTE